MDISDEVLIIDFSMNIESDDLTENTGAFNFIINSLELSYTDSFFMELGGGNEGVFIGLYHWLQKK